MGQQSSDDPRLVRRLSEGYIEALRGVAHGHARATALLREVDADAAGECEVEAGQLREFLRSIRDGDEIWLAERPSDHPELAHGVTSLAIVRSGKVVAKHRWGAAY